MVSVQIIGEGKAGGALYASLLNANISCEIVRRQDSLPADLSSIDILFLAVPDKAIQEVAKELAARSNCPRIVAHLCGAHGLDILSPLENLTQIAQFHPLTVMNGETPIAKETFVGICASTREAFIKLSELALELSLRPSKLHEGLQALYHAAAVILSNHSFVLAHDAQTLMMQAGVDEIESRQALASLLHSVASAIEQKPIVEAVTGPVKRKDFDTVARHIEILERYVKMSKELEEIVYI